MTNSHIQKLKIMPTLNISVTIRHTKMLRERLFSLTKTRSAEKYFTKHNITYNGKHIFQKQKEFGKLWNCLHIKKGK